MSDKDLQSSYVVLNRGHAESERLNQQYQFYKQFHQRKLIIDPTVSIPPTGAVLDAGTGTGAWILEIAQELSLSVSLHAVDLAPSLWPSSSIPSNVHYLVSSVTSLPEEWTNKFDLVNQSLLSGALKAADWPMAVSELYRVTKPGGHVQLCEITRAPPYLNAPSEAEAESASGMVWRFMMRLTDIVGRLRNPLSELSPMLEKAGFRDICIQVKPAPIGGKQYGGDSGVEALDMLEKAFFALKDIVLLNHGLGVVKNEEEYDQLIGRYLREIEETGAPAGVDLCYICARKAM